LRASKGRALKPHFRSDGVGPSHDQAILPEVKDGMRDWRLGRVVTVVDRGFSSADNLDYLQRAGGHFIAGERMRSGTPLVEQALARQGRYQSVRDNLRVKEVRLDGSPGRRWVICHNPDEAEREQATRDAALARISLELDRIKAIRYRATKTSTTSRTSKAKQTSRRRNADEAAHVKAECALRDHPALGRWLRQLPSGRLVIDRKKVAAEERLDGKYLLSTSDPDLSAEDIALGYKNLLEAAASAASAISSPPSNCGRCSTASSPASAPTSCSAGSRCC
jgi:hypothetical protein